MQRRRFYAPPIGDPIGNQAVHSTDDKAVGKPVATGERLTLSLEESHHLLRVLRLERGDEVFVFDGCGNEYRCRFAEPDGKRAVVEVAETLTDEVESPLALVLAQALAKGEKFDWIVQKATELGVCRIVPLLTAQADVRLKDEQASRRRERWQRIALEAAKQCGRRRLVEISEPLRVKEFLQNAAAGVRLYCSERGGALLEEALIGDVVDRQTSTVTVFVGPEGGWSNAEIDCFADYHCQPVTLGRRILRAETAAIVAVALLQHRLGDLSG